MGDIKKALDFMIEVANDNTHGYDQEHRNGPDYDCSSLLATALNKAGYNVKPTSYTGNLYSQLRACGFREITNGQFKAGDIHLTPGVHTAMSVDANRIVHARINEYGKVTGGKTGDQTGEEIAITKYYEPEGGWKYHLRAENNTELKSLNTVVNEVCNGKWGRGSARANALTEAGYCYPTIRAMVNHKMNKLPNYDYKKIAVEINNGDWGPWPDRMDELAKAGIDPIAVQMIANSLLQ